MPDEIHVGQTLLIEVVIENVTHSVCSDAYTPSGLEVDMDDDDDTYSDEYEMDCLSDHLDVMDIPVDSTLPSGDGVCDELDEDDDNDGYNDDVDAFSLDPNEWSDYDMDGYGDNTDMDDDNDGYWDSCEPADWLTAQLVESIEGLNSFNTDNSLPSTCPDKVDWNTTNSAEWSDLDGDNTGDNADPNDDGDFDANGNDWTDEEELACGTSPVDSTDKPSDNDGDGICDAIDTDDDGDLIPDALDAFPMDSTESEDLDGDGIGDEEDDDDDGDGWADLVEPNCGTDERDATSTPSDWDNDKQCDAVDTDDDNDGYDDPDVNGDDAFPNNPLEWVDTDGDGKGDNADTDDDGDGWLDVTETICLTAGGKGDPMVASEMPDDLDGDGLCDQVDPDRDGDTYPDPANINNIQPWEDHFPEDSTEWHDANNDGLGDNANQLTLVDDINAEAAPFVGVVVAVIGLGYGLVKMSRSGGRDDDVDDGADYTDVVDDFDFEDDDLDLDEEDTDSDSDEGDEEED